MSLVRLRWYHLCQTLDHCIFQNDQRDMDKSFSKFAFSYRGVKEDSHLPLKSLVSLWNLGENHRPLLEAWEGNHPKSDKEGRERTSGLQFGSISATPALWHDFPSLRGTSPWRLASFPCHLSWLSIATKQAALASRSSKQWHFFLHYM